MQAPVIFLSVPALRKTDVERMPRLTQLVAGGDAASLVPSFPCVTWPVQTNMLTGGTPAEHGIVANGFFSRDSSTVEMWTAWNDKILLPQVWDRLRHQAPGAKSAAWFPMLSKGCRADYVCMPAPIHNPDGSESLWCYTTPTELYGELRDELGHFPLQHFWGPLANIQSTRWIVESAVSAARRFQPDFFYVYLPHLDYAAQKSGPDSDAALDAVDELDTVLGCLVDGCQAAYGDRFPRWMVASEYTIVPVDHVSYPNRLLREEGLLQVRHEEGEQLDLVRSQAWALVDHQLSHVFVRDRNVRNISRVAEIFRDSEGIDEVLVGQQREKYALHHERSGDVILISSARSWQAYYWWFDDTRAPEFARRVDIHRKPGYDPVELHWDPATKSIPLDASLTRGSHGAPATSAGQQGVLLASQPGTIGLEQVRDVQVADLILRQLPSEL